MWRKVPLYQGNGAIAWASPEFQAQHPCFVIAPEFDEIIVDDTSTASNYLDATINLIKHLKTKFAFCIVCGNRRAELVDFQTAPLGCCRGNGVVPLASWFCALTSMPLPARIPAKGLQDDSLLMVGKFDQVFELGSSDFFIN